MEPITPSFAPQVGGPESDPQRPALIPLHRVPDLIPSSRPGKRLSLSTIFRWILKGQLRTVKVGGCRYVTAQDLADFVRSPSCRGVGPALEGAARAGEQLERALRPRGRTGTAASRPPARRTRTGP